MRLCCARLSSRAARLGKASYSETPRRFRRFANLRGLVLHQRDQRADHHAGPLHGDRGKLVAQRFSAAGGHDDRNVAALQDTLNDRFLLAAELRVAPMFLEETVKLDGVQRRL